MPREIGETILGAAQGVVQQLQNQQQLSLQMAQFGESIKAAEESIRLREENLKLEKEKQQLEAERIEISARNAAVGEKQAGVAEGRLEMSKRLEGITTAIKQGELRLQEAQIKKLEADIQAKTTRDGFPLGPDEVGGRFAIGLIREEANNLVSAQPERFIQALPQPTIDKFRGRSRRMVEAHIDSLGSQIEKMVEFVPLDRTGQQRQEIEALRKEQQEATQYLSELDRAAFDIRTGKNREALDEVSRSLFIFSEDPDARVRQLRALEAQATVQNPGETPLTLQNAIINPEIHSTQVSNQLDALIDTFPREVDTETVDAIADQLNAIMTPTATPDEFRAVAAYLERYAKFRNQNYEPATWGAVMNRLIGLRGLRKNSER
jgi:hypothetical protein